MDHYVIDVVKDDRTIAATQSVSLRNLRAAWPSIGELAKNIGELGYRIRVTNEAGEIEILVGVASARRYAAARH